MSGRPPGPWGISSDAVAIASPCASRTGARQRRFRLANRFPSQPSRKRAAARNPQVTRVARMHGKDRHFGVSGKAGQHCRERKAGETARPQAETDRFEIIVGLDDFDQPVFGRAVAAIAVRMVPLYEVMKLGLDLDARGPDVEPERIERLALGVADSAAFGLGARLARSEPALPPSSRYMANGSIPFSA